jgi:hypothetical protein
VDDLHAVGDILTKISTSYVLNSIMHCHLCVILWVLLLVSA